MRELDISASSGCQNSEYTVLQRNYQYNIYIYIYYTLQNKYNKAKYRKPPNISPGLIFVRKHGDSYTWGGLYTGGLI